ncbi:ABC transporter ATP-binding protein [Rhodococcus spelaei]|uniref:ABC transporter ATP-binding protein n=1 Tax=Rhodococcus spelaei TaxID=2546320 RepID=A0A541BNU3_9NOCA|nr:ABC transporter ATP-binding protein [Rhodococcus spelaei]TQF74001.1 ABC transporter ATP-binding protein [Rhodococcus spelaei]
MTSVVETKKPATSTPALTVEDLVVEFGVGRGQTVHAVSGISFTVGEGETLGVVGESGCGKSTAGKAIMQLPSPTSGSIRLGDVEMTSLDPEALRRSRTSLQMIFQDPISSLNPRRKVKALVTEGPSIWGNKDKAAVEKRAREVLAEVGLDPDMVWDRTPRELSGGQCQRVCIARALMLDPKVLICDEPVSSLDVSVQAQILNLLEDAKRRHGLSLLFIAHNMAVVKNISDRVMIMYLGRVCEIVPAEDMQNRALHPYTQLLLSSIPDPDAGATAEQNVEQTAVELPSPLNPPSGCRFRTRCPLATDRCAAEVPQLRLVDDGHQVACHNV